MKGKKEAFISTITEGGTIPIPSDVGTRLEITDGDNVEVHIEKLNLDRISIHRFYAPGRAAVAIHRLNALKNRWHKALKNVNAEERR